MKFKNIKILGLNYAVKEVEIVNRDERRFGEIRYIEQEIVIDKNLTEERKEQTLFHEVLHGVCEQIRLDELNEKENSIQSLSCALYQVFKDNNIISF